MVEVRGDEREQAEALTLLLQAVHTSPHLAAQYAGIRGNSLMFRILMSPLASPGVQVIKVWNSEVLFWKCLLHFFFMVSNFVKDLDLNFISFDYRL